MVVLRRIRENAVPGLLQCLFGVSGRAVSLDRSCGSVRELTTIHRESLRKEGWYMAPTEKDEMGEKRSRE